MIWSLQTWGVERLETASLRVGLEKPSQRSCGSSTNHTSAAEKRNEEKDAFHVILSYFHASKLRELLGSGWADGAQPHGPGRCAATRGGRQQAEREILYSDSVSRPYSAHR